MSDNQRTRRRFLADLLFLGGALGAGAFLTQATTQAEPQTAPQGTATPLATKSPEECPPAVRGEMTISTPTPDPEPVLGGKPAPPQAPPPHMDGDMAAPVAEPVVKGKVAAPAPDKSEERR